MPTDALSHARKVVAQADATAAGSMLGIIYRGERDTPPIAFSRDHPNLIAAQLADRCLRALADPATVEELQGKILPALHSPASGPVVWTDEKLAAAAEQASAIARAAILAILDQAGRDAT